MNALAKAVLLLSLQSMVRADADAHPDAAVLVSEHSQSTLSRPGFRITTTKQGPGYYKRLSAHKPSLTAVAYDSRYTLYPDPPRYPPKNLLSHVSTHEYFHSAVPKYDGFHPAIPIHEQVYVSEASKRYASSFGLHTSSPFFPGKSLPFAPQHFGDFPSFPKKESRRARYFPPVYIPKPSRHRDSEYY